MLVAVSGGIGSGKSLVANILATLGYDIYDCDSRARQLIDNNLEIKLQISEALQTDCLTQEGLLDRKKVGNIVFSDREKLNVLNRITHQAVREDLGRWYKLHPAELTFVETAILYQSGIDKMVDAVIEVNAPIEVRILRIMQRNGLSRNEALARINSQIYKPETPHSRIYTILNDGMSAILPQLQIIIGELQTNTEILSNMNRCPI